MLATIDVVAELIRHITQIQPERLMFGIGRHRPSRTQPNELRKITVNAGGLTDVGKVREKNEDALYVETSRKRQSELRGLLVVADGLGGHAGGEVASGIAVKAVKEEFSPKHNKGRTAPRTALIGLVRAAEEANTSILEAAGREDSLAGMGTTFTAVVATDQELHLVHVGDSRAYVIDGDGIRQITRDHTWVGQQVELGLMTREDAKSHPRRNLITRALGLDAHVEIETLTLRPRAGSSTLVLCSDGLYDVVDDDEILSHVQAAKTAKQACQRLVALANRRGGPDNITVIVARIRSD